MLNDRFGMFVHWGLYALPARHEWVKYQETMLDEKYDKYFKYFNPDMFNPKEWARQAKAAGMKYAVLTTKHHEGFCMFDSQYTDYKCTNTPAGRDLVREFVDACNDQGIIPFFYHTLLDWHEASYKENFKEYLVYLRASVEILCKNYGKIGGMWFDGNWSKPGADWKEDELYATIRKYQPEAIIVNNTGLSARGLAGHPEIDSAYESNRFRAVAFAQKRTAWRFK